MADAEKPTSSADAPREDAPPTASGKEGDKEEGEITPQKDASLALEESPITKHPLENSWTLWFDNPSGRQKSQWGDTLRKVYTFSTVEDFWCLYNHILAPSKLPDKSDFHCFKEGIEPKWEDPKCSGGGTWKMTVPKRDTDKYWLHTVLALIGEQFDDGNDICGAGVSVRKQDRVALWTRNANNEDLQVSLGKQWKDMVDFQDKVPFISHEDAKNNRKGNNLYV
eukprot:TRINITY_DN29519_c0_g1_i1.p1 TRINITY_DN29519_c0_g1~~TRINITY_DN29519_c0_g1_i1.p1  ORF type:complete len:224 (+),score=43.91 TRINITY_DN29519_c0_g1_i1:153-824(+)